MDVAALVTHMHENLSAIHETLSSLTTSDHDAKLDELEAYCETTLSKLHGTYTRACADLAETRRIQREALKEQRRREDEEREAARKSQDEAMDSHDADQDKTAERKYEEERRDVEEDVEVKMAGVEEAAESMIEGGRRRLAELEERRKELNRLIDEQVRAPLPSVPARTRARSSLCRREPGASGPDAGSGYIAPGAAEPEDSDMHPRAQDTRSMAPPVSDMPLAVSAALEEPPTATVALATSKEEPSQNLAEAQVPEPAQVPDAVPSSDPIAITGNEYAPDEAVTTDPSRAPSEKGEEDENPHGTTAAPATATATATAVGLGKPSLSSAEPSAEAREEDENMTALKDPTDDQKRATGEPPSSRSGQPECEQGQYDPAVQRLPSESEVEVEQGSDRDLGTPSHGDSRSPRRESFDAADMSASSNVPAEECLGLDVAVAVPTSARNAPGDIQDLITPEGPSKIVEEYMPLEEGPTHETQPEPDLSSRSHQQVEMTPSGGAAEDTRVSEELEGPSKILAEEKPEMAADETDSNVHLSSDGELQSEMPPSGGAAGSVQGPELAEGSSSVPVEEVSPPEPTNIETKTETEIYLPSERKLPAETPPSGAVTIDAEGPGAPEKLSVTGVEGSRSAETAVHRSEASDKNVTEKRPALEVTVPEIVSTEPETDISSERQLQAEMSHEADSSQRDEDAEEVDKRMTRPCKPTSPAGRIQDQRDGELPADESSARGPACVVAGPVITPFTDETSSPGDFQHSDAADALPPTDRDETRGSREMNTGVDSSSPNSAIRDLESERRDARPVATSLPFRHLPAVDSGVDSGERRQSPDSDSSREGELEPHAGSDRDAAEDRANGTDAEDANGAAEVDRLDDSGCSTPEGETVSLHGGLEAGGSLPVDHPPSSGDPLLSTAATTAEDPPLHSEIDVPTSQQVHGATESNMTALSHVGSPVTAMDTEESEHDSVYESSYESVLTAGAMSSDGDAVREDDAQAPLSAVSSPVETARLSWAEQQRRGMTESPRGSTGHRSSGSAGSGIGGGNEAREGSPYEMLRARFGIGLGSPPLATALQGEPQPDEDAPNRKSSTDDLVSPRGGCHPASLTDEVSRLASHDNGTARTGFEAGSSRSAGAHHSSSPDFLSPLSADFHSPQSQSRPRSRSLAEELGLAMSQEDGGGSDTGTLPRPLSIISWQSHPDHGPVSAEIKGAQNDPAIAPTPVADAEGSHGEAGLRSDHDTIREQVIEASARGGDEAEDGLKTAVPAIDSVAPGAGAGQTGLSAGADHEQVTQAAGSPPPPRDPADVSWRGRADSVPQSVRSQSTLSSAPSSPARRDSYEPAIRDPWPASRMWDSKMGRRRGESQSTSSDFGEGGAAAGPSDGKDAVQPATELEPARNSTGAFQRMRSLFEKTVAEEAQPTRQRPRAGSGLFYPGSAGK